MTMVYLSGPMTGIADYNFPAFNEAAKKLRDGGYVVFNPAETFEGRTDLEYTTYLREDIKALLDADRIVVLKDWEKSAGSRLEVAIGKAIGLKIFHNDSGHELYRDNHSRDGLRHILGMPVENETILEEAQRLVHGNRGADYGHPYYDFRRTALMVSGLLVDKLKDSETITPRDIPLIMNCVKMSREVNRPKRDNRTDGAGYWETLDMVDSLEKELKNGKDA